MSSPRCCAGWDACAAAVVDDDGTVYAVDLGTGSKRWTLALGAPSEESPPLVTDGSLVVGDASGGLHALDLSDGSPLWTQQLDGCDRRIAGILRAIDRRWHDGRHGIRAR